MSAQLGQEFPESEVYIDPSRVDEFITALGVSPAPGYVAAAGAEVPPGYFMYVTTYGAEPIHDALDFEMQRTVFGGSELEFHQCVRVGETLIVRPRISGISEKAGRSGHLTFVEITAEYRRTDGTLVLIERSNTVQRS